MVAPLYCGLDKVIVLPVPHLNMYLQQRNRPKQRGKGKRWMSRRSPPIQRKPKQLSLGSRFYCSYGNFLCSDEINDDGLMAPLQFGIVKRIFPHGIHPNICLQAEEKAQAQRKEQTRAAEEAETANAGKQVLLSILRTCCASMEPAMIEWWHQALIKSLSCMCFIPTCACRQRIKPKHSGKRMRFGY